MRLVQSRNQRPKNTIHHRWSGRHSKGTKNSFKPMVEAIEEQARQSPGKFWPTAGTVLKTILSIWHGGTSMDMWLPRDKSTDTMGLLASEGLCRRGPTRSRG